MTRTQICECGHVNHMHALGCHACPCRTFTTATDPEAAITAGATRKAAQITAALAKRRARLDLTQGTNQ